MIRAALYARYSSDQQNAASITDQQRVCRERAERDGEDADVDAQEPKQPEERRVGHRRGLIGPHRQERAIRPMSRRSTSICNSQGCRW